MATFRLAGGGILWSGNDKNVEKNRSHQGGR
jgi:hypothetical protein